MKRLSAKTNRFANEAKNKTTGYLIAAFGLVAGLAWNDAIKSLIEFLFPLETETIISKFVYAILVTLLLVLFTLFFIKLFTKHHFEK